MVTRSIVIRQFQVESPEFTESVVSHIVHNVHDRLALVITSKVIK